MSEIKNSTKDKKLRLSLLVGCTIGGLLSLIFKEPTSIPSGVSSLFLTLFIYIIDASLAIFIGAMPGAIVAFIFSIILRKSNIWLRLICIAIVTIIVVVFIRRDNVVQYANNVILTMKVNRADISGWTKVDYELPFGRMSLGHAKHIAVTPDGKIWFATHNDGIHVLDNDGWMTYTAQNSELLEDYITDLSVDPAGRVWIGTRDGISIIDGEDWLNYTAANSGLPGYSSDPDNTQTVMEIIFDRKGDAWIRTLGGGISQFKGQNWTTYFDKNPTVNGMYGSMATDGQGQVWVSMEHGDLFMFDGEAWQTIREAQEPPLRSSHLIRDIVVDNEDRIWIGSYQEVSSFDGVTWTNYGATLPKNSRDVEHLAISPDGTVWILTYKSDLYALESDGSWTNYSQLLRERNYAPDIFCIDDQNRFWFDDYYFVPPSQ